MSGNNKTALIIGGSRGIGRKIAEKLSDMIQEPPLNWLNQTAGLSRVAAF